MSPFGLREGLRLDLLSGSRELGDPTPPCREQQGGDPGPIPTASSGCRLSLFLVVFCMKGDKSKLRDGAAVRLEVLSAQCLRLRASHALTARESGDNGGLPPCSAARHFLALTPAGDFGNNRVRHRSVRAIRSSTIVRLPTSTYRADVMIVASVLGLMLEAAGIEPAQDFRQP
jgi:hypothetical protein